MSTTTTRQTAEERREAVLDAATHEFAVKGFHGASTEDIARAAGISQPYLFRLFGSKKELYLAAFARCEATSSTTASPRPRRARPAQEALQRDGRGVHGRSPRSATG